MAEQGLKVDLDASTGYASAVTGLASEVGTVGTGTLNGTTTLPGDCFGKIGNEVGLNAAFAAAAQAQLDALKAAGDPVQVGNIRTTNSGMSFYGFYRPTG